MRKEQLINENWLFRYHDGTETAVNIPHTWNNIDGQDGGDDYYRGTCVYEKDFTAPVFGEDERLYIEFAGVNASAKVILCMGVSMSMFMTSRKTLLIKPSFMAMMSSCVAKDISRSI